jgi:hypothetical protein
MKICDDDDQVLMVFDDLVVEKKQKVIEEYFIRGRKMCNGFSLIYSTQSYFATPKIIRLQCNYIILKKLSCLRDLNLILTDYSLDLTREELLKVYKDCTEEHTDFLMIAAQADESERYRKNWNEIIDITKYLI